MQQMTFSMSRVKAFEILETTDLRFVGIEERDQCYIDIYPYKYINLFVNSFPSNNKKLTMFLNFR